MALKIFLTIGFIKKFLEMKINLSNGSKFKKCEIKNRRNFWEK